MIAYLVLLIAVLSHVVPHPGLYSFTAVGAGLMYFGANRSRWQIAIAAVVLAASDYYLTVYQWGYAFHVSGYLITWAWYAGIALMGSALLRKPTVLRVVAGVLASTTSFFLLSNFAVWPGSTLYAQNAHGLVDCYIAALPFYGRDLISTGLFALIFFGWQPATAWVLEHAHGDDHTAA